MSKPLTQFPEEYFRPEVREGFFVGSMMKCVWAAQIEVLQEIERICDRHGLHYYADNGTLLGAVRHGGYIPWDDDLDICMFRDEYRLFFEYAKAELPDEYEILDFHEPKFGNLMMRVVSGRNINLSPDYLEKHHGCPYVVGVDIFPLDFLSDDPETENSRKELARIVFQLTKEQDQAVLQSPENRDLIDQLEALCSVSIDRSKDMIIQLKELGEALFSLYPREGATRVALMPYWLDYDDHVYSLELYDQTIDLPFENGTLKAPARYDEVLKIEYGNYIHVVKSWNGHEYPFYEDQENILGKAYPECLFYKYVTETEDLSRQQERRMTRLQSGIDAAKSHEDPAKKLALFLPVHAKDWPSMQGVYDILQKDSGWDVEIAVLPYYDRTPLGGYGDIHYEGAAFPAELGQAEFREYEMGERLPDVIFTQNPFDECNYTVSLPPAYYTQNLTRFTSDLVYLSPYDVDAYESGDELGRKVAGYYADLPGVVRTDHTLVSSEAVRENYIQVMTEKTGPETEEQWKEKIRVTSEYLEELLGHRPESEPAQEQTPGGRKKILYYTSVSRILQYREKALQKIREVLDTFWENRENVEVLWYVDPLIPDTLYRADPELVITFAQILREFCARFEPEGAGLLLDHPAEELYFEVDGYYGDPYRMCHRMRRAGIPIMIQNYDVMDV